MSKDSIKTQIDTDITNKTTSKSISPLNVGNNMKAVVDLIPDNISKTNGNVDAISGSKATLQYDINTVNKDGGSEVKLPTTSEVGKEVLFLASNYAGTVSVYVNDAEDVKLSGGPNGISGSQGNLQINANEAYRFIYRTNGYWYFEKIIDIPNNYYQLVSERSTDGTLASNSNFKYPTEQAVRTYVDSNSGIPLTGTTVGNPVSGEIEVLETAKGIWSKGGSYPDDYSGIFLGEGTSGLYFRNLFDNNEVSIKTYDSGVVISDNRLTAIGLSGLQDFSPNITDLDYTQKIYVDQKVADSRPYKVYTIILNQVGTAAPTAIVLENTIAAIGDLSWTRLGVGEYSLASTSGVFTNNKTYLSIQNGYPEIKNDISPAGVNEVMVYSYNITGGGVVPADNNIFDVSLEIRVYN